MALRWYLLQMCEHQFFTLFFCLDPRNRRPSLQIVSGGVASLGLLALFRYARWTGIPMNILSDSCGFLSAFNSFRVFADYYLFLHVLIDMGKIQSRTRQPCSPRGIVITVICLLPAAQHTDIGFKLLCRKPFLPSGASVDTLFMRPSITYCCPEMAITRRLQSDYDVCITCGSLVQCPHDQDEPVLKTGHIVHRTAGASCSDKAMIADADSDHIGRLSIRVKPAPASANWTDSDGSTDVEMDTPADSDGEPDTCEMVSNLPIPPYSEVFNTYGERLTNAQLLTRYGFVLDGNESDVVSFGIDDIPTTLLPISNTGFGDQLECDMANDDRGAFLQLFFDCIRAWPRFERWMESNLVYRPDHNSFTPVPSTASSFHAPVDDVRLERKLLHSSAPLHMCVNSDAQISHDLWVCCALRATLIGTSAASSAVSVEDAVVLLQQIAERQLSLEAQSDLNLETHSDADEETPINNILAETRTDQVCPTFHRATFGYFCYRSTSFAPPILT